MPAVTIHGQQVVWGTPANRQYGILVSYDEEETASTQAVEDENGATTGLVVYDTQKKVTATFNATSDATLPAAGTKIQLGSVSGVIVDTARKGRSNKGIMSVTVTGTRYAGIA